MKTKSGGEVHQRKSFTIPNESVEIIIKQQFSFVGAKRSLRFGGLDTLNRQNRSGVFYLFFCCYFVTT